MFSWLVACRPAREVMNGSSAVAMHGNSIHARGLKQYLRITSTERHAQLTLPVAVQPPKAVTVCLTGRQVGGGAAQQLASKHMAQQVAVRQEGRLHGQGHSCTRAAKGR